MCGHVTWTECWTESQHKGR